MYAHALYPGMDEQFQAQTQQLANFTVTGASPGRAPSPMNGERLDNEALQAVNRELKTRVSELEVIQELYRGRIQQLEAEEGIRQEAGKVEGELRAQLASLTEANAQLRENLDESHKRENMLKRRLDELEVELKNAKEAAGNHENGRAKRPRVDDGPTAAIDETPNAEAPMTAADP